MVIGYLILGIALLVGGLLLVRWFVSTEPRAVVRAARWTAVFAGLALVLVVLWGGGRQLLPLLFPLALPFLFRARWLADRIKSARGPKVGQSSTVETRYLRMTLDHDTGAMEGVVREGPWRGRRLNELDEAALIELWRECRAEDEQSAAVLEAYLDRAHGDGWRGAAGFEDATEGGRQGGHAGASPSGGGMSREEALAVLDLEPGASEEEIRAAHRRLMQQFHPDRGGTNYLAAKINEAKRVLLGK